MIILAKYATQLEIPPFPMIKAGTENFATSGDWTPELGDCKYSLDSGGVQNTANLPSNVGGTGSVLWGLTLTAGELTGKSCSVQIVDSVTKAVKDNAILVHTYGHASAQIPFDLSATFLSQFQTAYGTAMAEAYSTKGANASPIQLQYDMVALLTEFLKSGTSLTVRKRDGSTVAFTLTLNDATNPTSLTRAT